MAFVFQSFRILESSSEDYKRKTFPSLGHRALPALLRVHRQAKPAPTRWKGSDRWDGLPRAPGLLALRCRQGDTKLRRRARGPGGAARDRPAPAKGAHHGWRTPWRGRSAAATEPVREAASPRSSAPPRRARAWGRRRKLPRSRLDPSLCRAVSPPQASWSPPRGRVTAMPAAAIEQAWRGLGLAPGRPAGSRGRCGQAGSEDGAGASRRQSGGGRDSGDAALTRAVAAPPFPALYKCRAPALLPVGAGPEAGPT